ncbi:MAG: NADH-quinone oxidoreductase subunit L [Rubrobacteraceae bacterium]
MAFALLIPLLPLAAALFCLALKDSWRYKTGYLAAGAGLVSLLLSGLLAFRVSGGLEGELSYGWIPAAGDALQVRLLVDPVSSYMALIVSGVGFLVTVYAIGYMREDRAAGRFFAFFSFFIASMLGLVLAGDFLSLLVFWELVGLSSYALIGFYWKRPAAPPAATKAFLTTRTMDLGLYLAAFVIFGGAGTLSLRGANEAAGDSFAGPALVAAAVLILIAALGKSAQLPTVTWIADAMAGPTPVSALIHSATMVAAGVYLVARTFPIFEAAGVLWLVGTIGGVTAIFSGLAALWQEDLKRMLAASTSSQLGLMLLGLGVASPFAALFHLLTQAVFKSLLFLGAGNIQEALGTTDMRKMGGLRKTMPVTFWTFVIGALSLAAVPPLAGFFSKDYILAAALEVNPWFFALGVASSLVTAAYALRAVLLPFFGQGGGGAAERPPVMLAPAVILAAFTLILGFFGAVIVRFLRFEEAEFSLAVLVSLVAVLAGFLGVWALWRRGDLAFPRRFGLGVLARPAASFFGLDAVINILVVRPTLATAAALAVFDERVVDAGVDLAGRSGLAFARMQGAFDDRGVDGVVREAGAIFVAGGRVFRRIQTGLVHHYLIMGFVSLLVLILVLGLASV